MTSASALGSSSMAKVAMWIPTLQMNILMAGHELMFVLSCFLWPPSIELFMPNSTISLGAIVRLVPNYPVVNVLP